MSLRIGQVLRGKKAKYELLSQLKDSSVFKAQLLSNSSTRGQSVVVKGATTRVEKVCLKRENRNYEIPEVTSCPYIKASCDTIPQDEGSEDPPYLVFEWMDLDLRSAKPQFRGDPRLPKIVSKSVLSALQLFKSLGAVHTDININNVFLSNIDGPSPIAKLGDLGNLIADGYAKQRLQSLPCRAPEVWQGLGVQHASDVWSLGVTLAHALSPRNIFGEWDQVVVGHTEAWCIAKIIRLVGPLDQPVDCQAYLKEFELAKQLAVMDNTLHGGKLIKQGTLREELQLLSDPPVSPQLLDFIDYLLVVDYRKRPTASEALQHPYLQSLP